MADVLPARVSPSVHVHHTPQTLRRAPSSTPQSYFDTPSRSSRPKQNSSSRKDHREQTASWLIGSSSPDNTSPSTHSSASNPYPVHVSPFPEKSATPPSYEEGPFYDNEVDFACSEASTASSVTDTARSESPVSTPTIFDDSSLRRQPSRQVDFLSYDWREEDIWSSWRNIVSQRRSTYGEKSRLENASWRTWAKSKYRLRTVAPERLNWLKESDVTWLYGPLTTATTYPITMDRSVPSSQISKNNSFADLKPILKKRSMSEVMLQRSLSTSSLVKQATASIQAQGWQENGVRRDSDPVDSKMPSEAPSRDQFDYLTSRSTSGNCTPSETRENRHIRFDDRVEQCIAVECKYVEQDENDSDNEAVVTSPSPDSSSDEGVVMMRQKRPSVKRSSSGKSSRSGSFDGRKTIETLPCTTLKYRTDSPDMTAGAQHHTFASSWTSGKLNHSSSQETLRPTNTNRNTPYDHESEDVVDADSSWSFEASNPRSVLASASRNRSGTNSPTWENECQYYGMRRTGSGMFMPDDGEDDESADSGFFGRVSTAINTARDIGHVIWTVGWGR